MAVTEVNPVMKYKDVDGNITAVYPVTKTNAVTTTGNGSAYEATVKGISELTVGASFVLIPHVDSTSVSPGLNVNGLGSAEIRRRISTTTNGTILGESESWLVANQPIEVMYNGEFWIADIQRPSANDLVGSVPVDKGGTGASTAATARYNLGAVNMVSTSVTLFASEWLSSNEQHITVSGVTYDNTVIISPTPVSYAVYVEAGVHCSGQADAKLSFICDDIPSEDLIVNVVILT